MAVNSEFEKYSSTIQEFKLVDDESKKTFSVDSLNTTGAISMSFAIKDPQTFKNN